MAEGATEMRLAVEVTDLDQAMAFYRDALGLKQVTSDGAAVDSGTQPIAFAAGSAVLELVQAPPSPPSTDEVVLPTLAFTVDDAEAVAARLRPSGATTGVPVRDPAGLTVSLVDGRRDPLLSPEYPIVTDRLLLRPFRGAADAAAVHAYRSRDDVCRYVPISPLTLEAMAKRLGSPTFTRTVIDDEGQALTLAVERRDTGQLIGDVVLFWNSAEHRAAELGYVFNPDHGGHGFATEAARAVLRLAFDGLDAHRVTAKIDDRNAASVRLAERLGMRQESVLVECERIKDEWITLRDFAILAREWHGGGARSAHSA